MKIFMHTSLDTWLNMLLINLAFLMKPPKMNEQQYENKAMQRKASELR